MFTDEISAISIIKNLENIFILFKSL